MLATHSNNAAHLSVKQNPGEGEVLKQIKSGQLLVVNPRRRNGIVIYRKFHAVFAGPGSAVGGDFDRNCVGILPLGKLSLLDPGSYDDQQKALRIRLQWVRLTQNFTDRPIPVDRAQMILEQFQMYFDQKMVGKIPDDAFAQMVGVFPETIRLARQSM
ncbi:MAG: hypothetical protein O2890_12675 [Cyanobacteria bacterium]|nr:hypothetical protein [Cyanobacteriota bacterium]MDA0867243.1 hypothetical protein [Cyanobacteriota bacterium]